MRTKPAIATGVLGLCVSVMGLQRVVAARLVGNERVQRQPRILVGPNLLVSRDSDCNLGELLIAANPVDPRNLLGSGICFRTNHPQGGQENRGYYSLDGGYRWATIRFPEQTSGGGGDPQVAFGRTGTAYFVSLGHLPSRVGLIQVYRSEDGGIDWGKPISLGASYDHEQIAVDHSNGRFSGNVYLSAIYSSGHGQFGAAEDAHVGVFRSTDDARSWSGPVELMNNHHLPGRGIQAMNLALFKDGEILAPFVDYPGDPAIWSPEGQERAISTKYHYWFATSNDGGATFSGPQKFVLQGGGVIDGPFSHFPFFAIDNSDGAFRDRVYIVWADRDFRPRLTDVSIRHDRSERARFLISHSSDRGKSWSKPKMISAGLPDVGDQFAPQSIAVNKCGTVAVSWYDTTDTPAGHGSLLVNRYLAASIDGGESFLPAVRVSSAPTDLAVTGHNLVGAGAGGTWRYGFGAVSGTSVELISGAVSHGEYLGLTEGAAGIFHVFWTDGRTGSNQIWTAPVSVDCAAENNEEPPKAKPTLVQADVSDRLEPVLDPIRQFSQATVDVPIRLTNKSGQPVYGPIVVEVTSLTPEGVLLNAADGQQGVGAKFDYSHTLGDFDFLPPGAVSEALEWRFRTPATAKDFPRLTFKVTARIAVTGTSTLK